MKKLLFVVIVLFAGVALAGGYVLKNINQNWQTICEGNTNRDKAAFVISNTGDNALTDCKIEQWNGSAWSEIEAWPECQSLAKKTVLRKNVETDAKKVRLQAVSDSGTQGWCIAVSGPPLF
jgi:hypothetical protein